MSLSKIAGSLVRVLSRQTSVVSSRGLSSLYTGTASRIVLAPQRSLAAAYSNSARTKGDEELSGFLADEIAAEIKNRKPGGIPKIDKFEIKTKGSEITLSRKFNDEAVTVQFNVNHSVDGDDNASFQENQTDAGEMLSKPNFEVVIDKGSKKLLLSCTFSNEDAQDQQQGQEGYEDLFSIVEVSMYEGDEVKDSHYSVSGHIMDGQLYDLLMNLLEERGISNDFAQQLVDFSTAYEHGQYINLLENLKGFVSK